MCRISATVNLPTEFAPVLHGLQANGATRGMEHYLDGGFSLIHSRFDVTTHSIATGTFPYTAGRFAFHYNGEIFACGTEVFSSADFPSDVEFAASALGRYLVHDWLVHLDFQGTIQILDREKRRLYVAVDQLNSQGGFYARWGTSVIVAQEVAILEHCLRAAEAPEKTPIRLIKPGHYIIVDERGNVEEIYYRKHAEKVFNPGQRILDAQDFRQSCSNFHEAFYESVKRRLPKGDEPVGVLCGAGVDSAYLLLVIANILKPRRELKRLHVFTLGWDLRVEPESNDWANSKQLFDKLNLRDGGAQLHRIPPIRKAVKRLYRDKIFCSGIPRLITPNPVLNTQIRHTVRMSAMLEFIAHRHPNIRVVLSGDGADELFAGYNSMWNTALSAEDVKRNVLDKLQDLTLNDFARVALAAFHGTCAVAKSHRIAPYLRQQTDGRYQMLADRLHESSQEELRQLAAELGINDQILARHFDSLHPVEVRLPFASHLVLNALSGVNPAYLVGEFDGRFMSKFLLRCAANMHGLPVQFSRRKKMPLHEGGTGVKNSERFSLEVDAAGEYSRSHNSKWTSELAETLTRLSLVSGIARNEAEHEQVVAVRKAIEAGLSRLIRGNVFRGKMPDCIYSTTDKQIKYRDAYFAYRSDREDDLKLHQTNYRIDQTTAAA